MKFIPAAYMHVRVIRCALQYTHRTRSYVHRSNTCTIIWSAVCICIENGKLPIRPLVLVLVGISCLFCESVFVAVNSSLRRGFDAYPHPAPHTYVTHAIIVIGMRADGLISFYSYYWFYPAKINTNQVRNYSNKHLIMLEHTECVYQVIASCHGMGNMIHSNLGNSYGRNHCCRLMNEQTITYIICC